MGRRTAVLATLAAFTIGGAIGVGGFAVGQRSATTAAGDGSISTIVAPSTSSPDTILSDDPTVQTTIITESGVEPAAAVAAVVGPSVVQVETPTGQGSGVVYAEGLILTNHHVIANSQGRVGVRSSDGELFEVEVLGSDARNDIAVLSAPDADLPVAALGSIDELAVGQLAVAIGSPFALQQTVTSGIVSSLNRPVPNMADSYSAMIQTDASINPGNSGGALANRNGEVIGINASIRTDGLSNTNVGIGFAIPIDTALAVAERIVGGESLDPAVLGVTGRTVDDGVGVPINEVIDGSAAAEAGLRPGDRIVTIDGAPVTNIQEVIGLIQSNFPGDAVELLVTRDGTELVVEAVLD